MLPTWRLPLWGNVAGLITEGAEEVGFRQSRPRVCVFIVKQKRRCVLQHDKGIPAVHDRVEVG